MNPSRARLGPENDPARAVTAAEHSVRYVIPDKRRYRGVCACGWSSGRRKTAGIAREALDAHIAQS